MEEDYAAILANRLASAAHEYALDSDSVEIAARAKELTAAREVVMRELRRTEKVLREAFLDGARYMVGGEVVNRQMEYVERAIASRIERLRAARSVPNATAGETSEG
jgi:hypothetical protein